MELSTACKSEVNIISFCYLRSSVHNIALHNYTIDQVRYMGLLSHVHCMCIPDKCIAWGMSIIVKSQKAKEKISVKCCPFFWCHNLARTCLWACQEHSLCLLSTQNVKHNHEKAFDPKPFREIHKLEKSWPTILHVWLIILNERVSNYHDNTDRHTHAYYMYNPRACVLRVNHRWLTEGVLHWDNMVVCAFVFGRCHRECNFVGFFVIAYCYNRSTDCPNWMYCSMSCFQSWLRSLDDQCQTMRGTVVPLVLGGC